MRNYLGIGIFICASCAQTVDAPTNAEPISKAVKSSALTTDPDGGRTVTLDLGQARVIEFIESPDGAWVFERRPMEAASVLGADISAPSLYREFRHANPELPELFANYPATVPVPITNPQVGVSVNALTKDEFLAGDHICNHYCGTVDFQEHSAYPFETTEKCRTDITGRNFRPADDAPKDGGPPTDTTALGEKLFFAVNARDIGGTFTVKSYMQQWTFDGSDVTDYKQSGIRSKTKVLERGEAFSGGLTIQQTGQSNVYRRGTAWAELIGDDEGLYDYYTCAVVSRTSPSAQQGQ